MAIRKTVFELVLSGGTTLIRFRAGVQLAAMLVVLSGMSCVEGGSLELIGVNKTKAAEVRQLIAKELQPGTGSALIEKFFRENDIAYSFDRFSSRYQAIIRDVATRPWLDQAVVILVHVDDQKRFLSAEVNDSFTGP